MFPVIPSPRRPPTTESPRKGVSVATTSAPLVHLDKHRPHARVNLLRPECRVQDVRRRSVRRFFLEETNEQPLVVVSEVGGQTVREVELLSVYANASEVWSGRSGDSDPDLMRDVAERLHTLAPPASATATSDNWHRRGVAVDSTSQGGNYRLPIERVGGFSSANGRREALGPYRNTFARRISATADFRFGAPPPKANHGLAMLLESDQIRSEKVKAAMATFPLGKRRRWEDLHFSQLFDWHLTFLEVPTAAHDALFADILVEMQFAPHLQTLTIVKLSFAERCGSDGGLVPDLSAFSRLHALCYRGLESACFSLSSLTLTMASIGTPALVVLCEWLVTTNTQCALEMLDLSHNSIGPIGLECLTVALQFTRVHTLSLHGNPLGEWCGDRLVELLCDCPPLRSVDVGFCMLRDEAVSKLLEKFSSIPLERLCLDNIDLDSQTALQLLASLANNSSLLELEIRFTPVCQLPRFKVRLAGILQRSQPGATSARARSRSQRRSVNAFGSFCVPFEDSAAWNPQSPAASPGDPNGSDPASPATRSSSRVPSLSLGGLTPGYHKYNSNFCKAAKILTTSPSGRDLTK